MGFLNESGRDAVEDGTGSDDGDAGGLTRRAVLRESAIVASAVGLSLGAVGTAAASGKGGQSAVPAEDYLPEEGRFHFDEATGNFVRKTCEKGGNGIVLAEWTFRYEGESEDTERSIYTRDNAIDTTQTFEFAGNGTTDCGDFYLTPFSRAQEQ